MKYNWNEYFPPFLSLPNPSFVWSKKNIQFLCWFSFIHIAGIKAIFFFLSSAFFSFIFLLIQWRIFHDRLNILFLFYFYIIKVLELGKKKRIILKQFNLLYILSLHYLTPSRDNLKFKMDVSLMHKRGQSSNERKSLMRGKNFIISFSIIIKTHANNGENASPNEIRKQYDE